MKGQAKAMIPALIGITPLLLAGITGYVISSGGQQATQFAPTLVAKHAQHSRTELTDSFRAGARLAAKELGDSVAADLAIELTRSPALLLAASDAAVKERG